MVLLISYLYHMFGYIHHYSQCPCTMETETSTVCEVRSDNPSEASLHTVLLPFTSWYRFFHIHDMNIHLLDLIIFQLATHYLSFNYKLIGPLHSMGIYDPNWNYHFYTGQDHPTFQGQPKQLYWGCQTSLSSWCTNGSGNSCEPNSLCTYNFVAVVLCHCVVLYPIIS